MESRVDSDSSDSIILSESKSCALVWKIITWASRSISAMTSSFELASRVHSLDHLLTFDVIIEWDGFRLTWAGARELFQNVPVVLASGLLIVSSSSLAVKCYTDLAKEVQCVSPGELTIASSWSVDGLPEGKTIRSPLSGDGRRVRVVGLSVFIPLLLCRRSLLIPVFCNCLVESRGVIQTLHVILIIELLESGHEAQLVQSPDIDPWGSSRVPLTPICGDTSDKSGGELSASWHGDKLACLDVQTSDIGFVSYLISGGIAICFYCLRVAVPGNVHRHGSGGLGLFSHVVCGHKSKNCGKQLHRCCCV